MPLYQLDRTATVAWCDADHEHTLLATGTDAQQLDATFSTSATLDVFDLDAASDDSPGKPSVVASVTAPQRFHRLAWTKSTSASPAGLIIGGMDNGVIGTWDANMLLNDKADALRSTTDHHSGPVRALDINPFQHHLLASGSSAAEVFIWDLNNPNKHLTPGPRASPADDVSCVAWNRQVEYILASGSPSGRSIVWDLRASRAIINLSEGSGTFRCRAIAWHPNEATQLVVASEDDRRPAVVLWDLRNASAPVRDIGSHSRGIMSLDWCSRDPSLIVSGGKDNQILCWDAYSSNKLLAQLPSANNWVFDVSFCPRNPDLIAAAAFDSHVSIHSLTTPSSDNSSQFMSQEVGPALSRPPGWLARPVGATFGFGGQLVTVPMQIGEHVSRSVNIMQLSDNVEQRDFANKLASTLSGADGEQTADFCHSLATQEQQSGSPSLWSMAASVMLPEPRPEFLNLLGYSLETLTQRVRDMTGADVGAFDASHSQLSPDKHKEAERLAMLALRAGLREAAVDLCLASGRIAEACMIGLSAGPSTVGRVQQYFFATQQDPLSTLLHTIQRAHWQELVETAELSDWQSTLALLLTYASAAEFPTHATALGKALLDANGSDNRLAAATCFFAAGQPSLVAEALATTDAERLAPGQELVGMVAILAKAVSAKGAQASADGATVLKPVLDEFCNHAAEQGSAQAALNILNHMAQAGLGDALPIDVYNRLRVMTGVMAPPVTPGPVPDTPFKAQSAHQGAINAAQAHAAPTTGRVNTFGAQPAAPASSGAASFFNPNQAASAATFPTQFNQTAPAQNFAPASQHMSAAAPASVASPMNAASTMQPPSIGAFQPPPPASHAAASFGNSSYATPAAFQGPPAASTPSIPGQTSAATSMSQPFAPPASAGMQQPPAVSANVSHVPQAASSYMSPGFVQPGTFNASPVSVPAPMASQHQQARGSVASPAYHRQEDKRWNDPPMITKKKASHHAPPAAIVNPLQQAAASPQAPPTAGGAQAMGNVQNQAAAAQQQRQQQQQQQAPASPPKKELPPMPEEHKPLWEDVVSILNACDAKKTSATARKLADAEKRLESLKEKLCLQQLDQDILMNLKGVVYYVKVEN